MMRVLCLTSIAAICLACGTSLAQVRPPQITPSQTQSAYAPVVVEGRKLFDIMGSGSLTASERADKVMRRLNTLITRGEDVPPFTARDIVPANSGSETLITIGGEPILSVSDSDAQDELSTRANLALLWGNKMASAVADARATRRNPIRGAGIVIRNSFSDLIISTLEWLPRLAGALLLLAVFWSLARFARLTIHLVVSRTHLDPNLRQLMRAVAYFGTWIVGIVAILATLGLQSSGIAAALGVSGFVLGFAFKDILSHFFAGFMLLIGRQFHIGDQIIVKEYEGTVERIELRALYLRTYDNRLVIIPNGDVFTSAVTSNTASPHRRREFVIGIGYSDDAERAQQIALETTLATPGVLEHPVPDVLVDELAASTVNLKIRFYMNSMRADYLKVGSNVMLRVKQAFDRNGVSMPTDIQTVIIENLKEVVGRTDDTECDPGKHGQHGQGEPQSP